MGGLLLGLIDIAVWVAIASIIVFIIIYGAQYLGYPVPAPIQKLLWLVVGLIALGMLVGLLLGSAPPRVWGGHDPVLGPRSSGYRPL